jgi:bacillithiol biosynthesis deacetylase BshB1
MDTLDLLVFAAHPDDAEIGMGGTIAKHTAAGYRVGICDLTKAEMSSNGTPEERQIEAAVAAQTLGITTRVQMNLPDRGLNHQLEQILALVEIIRTYKPKVVFAPYWIDRHPDHVACCRLVEEAVFNAKLRRYHPDSTAHQIDQLYYYFIHEFPQADVIIDVSNVHATKMRALEAYRSQFMSTHEMNQTTSVPLDIIATPLNQGYLEQVLARDRVLGQQYGVRYAEGFVSREAIRKSLFL